MADDATTHPPITRELILALPKTDLHVHLDGSLRPETVLELVGQYGIEHPARTPAEMQRALSVDGSRSLEEYLEVFEFTLRLLQERSSIERVAYELAVDAAAENVRHLEVRFAPILHQSQGLSLDEILDAALAGLSRANSETGIRTGVIVCGIRHIRPERSLDLADLAVRYKHRGVVAFDLAGAERDNPAKHHLEAFYRVLNANLSCTVHAGEAFGPASIHQAIHYCGAHRIGHGTRLREDPELLAYVNDHRIPIEMCLTSNLHTGAISRLEDHPFRDYFDLGLRVTLNTDNRLISNTTVTDELVLACEMFRLTPGELRYVILNGFKSAFLPFAEKVEMMARVVEELDSVLQAHHPDSSHHGRSIL